jgi:hypothetical protein
VAMALGPSASPMPPGFRTVAIAVRMLSRLQTQILAAAERPAVAFAVLPAFVFQIVVAAFALADRDEAAATVMAGYAASWLVNALIVLTAPAGAAGTMAFLFIFTVSVAMMAIAARPDELCPPCWRCRSRASSPCSQRLPAHRRSPWSLPSSALRWPQPRHVHRFCAAPCGRPAPHGDSSRTVTASQGGHRG